MAAPKLQDDIIAAKRELVGRFEGFSQNVDGGKAWGFSLDPRNSQGQVGIYGTVAAVEVLTMAGRAPDSTLVSGGLNSLRKFFPDKNRRWHQKHDLDTTLKRAWMARVEPLGKAAHKHRKWLVATQLEGLGWGGYTGEDYRADTPDLISTCFALIGLADHENYRGSNQATAAIQWVLDEVGDIEHRHVGDLAIAVIGVTAFTQTDDAVQERVKAFVERVTPKLREYAKRKRLEPIPAFRDYFHLIGRPPDARREPFQIPLELAVLRALLGTGDAENIRACRPAIRRLTSSIVRDGGVDVDGFFRTETQLWAAQVLFGIDGRTQKILSNRWVPWRDSRFVWMTIAIVVVLVLMGLDVMLEESPEGATGLWWFLRDVLAIVGNPLTAFFELILVALIARWKSRE